MAEGGSGLTDCITLLWSLLDARLTQRAKQVVRWKQLHLFLHGSLPHALSKLTASICRHKRRAMGGQRLQHRQAANLRGKVHLPEGRQWRGGGMMGGMVGGMVGSRSEADCG